MAAGPDGDPEALGELLSSRPLLDRVEAMRAEIASTPTPADLVAQLVERAADG